MSWYVVEVFDDRACTNSMSRLQGACRDFQHLAECADGVSSHPSGGVRTRVSHHDDPQRVAPTGMAIGRENTKNALGDALALIPRRYDNPNRLDFRR
jgi:hypothetical protein